VTSFTGSLSLSGMTLGSYTVNVRARNSDGSWGVLQTTTLTLQPLFADGFEGATLSPPWSSTNGAIRLAVTSAARLTGSQGLEARITQTGTGNQTEYVRSNTPVLNLFHGEFQFNANTLTTAGRWADIYQALQGNTLRFAVQYQRTGTTGSGSVRLLAGGTASAATALSAGTHTIRVDYVGGVVQLLVDGTPAASGTTTGSVNNGRLGITAWTAGAAGKAGVGYFDSYVASRYPLP
jgi:hypothetical protein